MAIIYSYPKWGGGHHGVNQKHFHIIWTSNKHALPKNAMYEQ